MLGYIDKALKVPSRRHGCKYMKDLPNALALYINKDSAEKMGVKLPPDLLKRAAHVF
jgi:ABC-type uncharacterized transport system substrate-binding protein